MYFKKFLLYLTMLIVFTIPSYATFTEEWGEYQNHYNNRGFVHDNEGHWIDKGTTYSYSSGMNFQPLVVDLDNDNDRELIVFKSGSNYLQLFDSTMSLVDETVIANLTYIAGQPTIYNNGTVNHIVFRVGNSNQKEHFLVYSYNGSFNQICDLTIPVSWNERGSGIKCKGNYCYFIDAHLNNNKAIAYKINMSNMGCTIAGNFNDSSADCIYHSNFVPALDDIKNENYDSLVFYCDDNLNGNYGIWVVRTDTMDLDTSFSVDGKIDDLTNTKFSSPMIYNLDGAGHKEIITSYATLVGNHPLNTVAYKSDGSAFYDKSSSLSDDFAVLSTPLISFQGDDRVVCTVSSPTGNADSTLFCIEEDGTDYIDIVIDNVLSVNGLPIVSADLLGTSAYDELATPLNIYSLEGGMVTKLLSDNLSSANNYYLSVVDIDNDKELDIVMSNSTTSLIVKSTFENLPPILLSRNFGQNYVSPVCVGTTVTFTGAECGNEPCHYTNDVAYDTERLVGTCGNNVTMQNGTFILSTPSLSCYYGNLGNYIFDVYLQDNANPDDYTQAQEKTIIVFNGTAGLTCNIPVTPKILVGENETTISPDDAYTSEEEIHYVVDTLTGQSQFMEGLMVLVFTAIAIFAFVKHGVTNPLIFTVSIFALWITFAMLGILSWVYVMLFAFVSIMLTATTFVMGRKD